MVFYWVTLNYAALKYKNTLNLHIIRTGKVQNKDAYNPCCQPFGSPRALEVIGKYVLSCFFFTKLKLMLKMNLPVRDTYPTEDSETSTDDECYKSYQTGIFSSLYI